MLVVFVTGLVLAMVYTGVLVLRMRRDWRRRGALRASTAALTTPAYILHGAALAVAVMARLWPVPVAWWAAVTVGGLLVLGGLALSVAGMTRFRSVGQVGGNEPGDLVTGGVYRWTRNPQYIGWGLVLLGVGLVSRSGAAIVAAAAYWLLMRGYLPVEEAALQQQFGARYARYRRVSHRWFGPPMGRGATDA